MTYYGDYYGYGYDEEHYDDMHHDNYYCEDEANGSYFTTELSCDYFPVIEYTQTCYIMYTHDACDPSDFTCSMPHYDLEGNWQYDDCAEDMMDYDMWVYGLREEPIWHDTTMGHQLPFIHEHWDNYHGIVDMSWWGEAWGYSDDDYYEVVSLYDDYHMFKDY